MVNERIKMAESIDAVHTHTHTPYSYKQNWWTVWRERERELTFSEINNNKLNIDCNLKDSDKSLKN